MGHDPDSPKVKAIRVPARLNGHVGMISLVRVAFAGPAKQPEFVVVQIEHASTQVARESCGPWSVLRIGAFVDPS
jgi:hypothetical protein